MKESAATKSITIVRGILAAVRIVCRVTLSSNESPHCVIVELLGRYTAVWRTSATIHEEEALLAVIKLLVVLTAKPVRYGWFVCVSLQLLRLTQTPKYPLMITGVWRHSRKPAGDSLSWSGFIGMRD